MPLDTEGYFHTIRDALDRAPYVINGVSGTISLRETIDTKVGNRKIELALRYTGDIFAIKLDCKNHRGKQEPLFHFFSDASKPWARRCDFIVFHLQNKKIDVRLIEFKWESLPVDSICSQLSSSFAWLQTMHSAIKYYMRHGGRLNATKFVFSSCANASRYLDTTGKYLQGDAGIRHYLYDEAREADIASLENRHVYRIV